MSTETAESSDSEGCYQSQHLLEHIFHPVWNSNNMAPSTQYKNQILK